MDPSPENQAYRQSAAGSRERRYGAFGVAAGLLVLLSAILLEVRVEGRSSAARVPLSPVPHWTVAPDGGRIALLTTEMDGSEGGIWRLQLL
ncbi:MAG: hypothetical protein MUO35_01925, partial [Anaerolineales bacterium]|nr:hypothetical protein [Anaerolineales bacterium]